MGDESLRFADTHEWARLEDGIVTVGLSEYALEQLGDVVYMELPEVDDDCVRASAMGVVESVKAASDLYSPISGTVVEVNEDILDNFDVLKEDAYDKGWLVKIEPADLGELDMLMDAEEYNNFIQGEDEDEEEPEEFEE